MENTTTQKLLNAIRNRDIVAAYAAIGDAQMVAVWTDLIARARKEVR